MSLRKRTVNGIRKDFRGQYPNVLCPLECGETDTLENLLSCSVLNNLSKNKSIQPAVQFQDLFSDDVNKQNRITNIYKQLLEKRNNMLNSPPVADTGPMH